MPQVEPKRQANSQGLESHKITDMSAPLLEFSVPSWSSWQASTSADAQQPDVSAIPAMLRRRLNLLGRACASQALPYLKEQPELPIVYCSQHGDIERTLNILLELAKTGDISPMNFSLAVHNAVCGVMSIHAGVRGPINSIAAGEDYMLPVLIEALGLLNENHSRVLCVVCDVPLPDIYQSENSQPSTAFASAFLVERAKETVLQLRPGEGHHEPHAESASALQFCRFLEQSNSQAITLRHNGMHWSLDRNQ